MRSIGDRAASTRGLTMIELMVVLLIVGVVAGATLSLYVGVMRSFADSGNRMINQDDARTAINAVTRYVRMATISAANQTSVSDAIALAQPQDLVLYSDIDGDNVAEKLRFYLSGTNLKMAAVDPNMATNPPTYPPYTTDGVLVMDGVRNGALPLFSYCQYDASQQHLVVLTNPTSAADRAKIVAVTVTVEINEGPELSKGNVGLSTLVQIRQRYNGGLVGY